MTNCKYKSYRYGEKIYRANKHQIEVLNQVRRLPRKHLHYIVAQQADNRPNINLKQMKNAIKRAVRGYVKESNYPYSPALDNLLVQYLCVFETTKEFHLSHCEQRLNEDFYLGLHCHIFLTSPDNYPWVCFTTLAHRIFHELTDYPKRGDCLKKYDTVEVDKLNDPFILYHTKQLYQRPSREMILTNVA